MRRTTAAMLALLMLVGVAAAQNADDAWQTEIEKKLAQKTVIKFQEQTLSKVLDYFRRTAKLNIVLDSKAGALSELKFTLALRTKVKVESGIAWTARLMGLEYAVQDESIFLARRNDMPIDWRAQMQERYRKRVASGQEAWVADIDAKLSQKLKVDFRNDHLPVILGFLGTQSGLNIVLDQHLLTNVKPIKLEGEYTVRSVLNWITRLAQTEDGRDAHVKYVVRDEVIYVARKQELEALRLETGESTLAMTFRRPVTYRFTRTPLKEALARLSRNTNVPIRLDGLKPDEKVLINLNGDAEELNRAVRKVMDQTGRPYAISFTGKTVFIVISPPDKKPPTRK